MRGWGGRLGGSVDLMWVSAAGTTPAILPQLTALVVAGALVAYLGFGLRLVPIVAFVLTGVVIGPNALGLVEDLDVVEAASEVGVLLLSTPSASSSASHGSPSCAGPC